MVHTLKNPAFIDLLAYSTRDGCRVNGRFRPSATQADAYQADQTRWEAVRHCLTAILGEANLHGALDLFALGKSCKDHAAELGVHPGNACRRKQKDILRTKRRIMKAIAGPVPSGPAWQTAYPILMSYCRDALTEAVLAGFGASNRLAVIDPRLAEAVPAAVDCTVLMGTERHTPAFPTSAEIWAYVTHHYKVLFCARTPSYLRLRMAPSARAWVIECVRPFNVKAAATRRSA